MRKSSSTSASKRAVVDGGDVPLDASAGVLCRSRGADEGRCGGPAVMGSGELDEVVLAG